MYLRILATKNIKGLRGGAYTVNDLLDNFSFNDFDVEGVEHDEFVPNHHQHFADTPERVQHKS